MNCFIWSKDNNDWIFPEDQYDEELNNWRVPIHNGQFHSQTLKEKRKTEETCSKYTDSAKFNGIPREVNPVLPIKSYKDQCCEHMIRNGMWDVFPLIDPRNKEKRWYILLHQSRFPLDYVKLHVDSLLKSSEEDQHFVQNLTRSGLYLRSNLSNTLLQKVLTLVPLTATVPEVFVATMTTFLSDSYDKEQ